MDSITEQIKCKISTLSRNELEKLVLKAASKHKEFNAFLRVNYIDKQSAEDELFDEAKADLGILMGKSYKGYAQELKLANMLTACNKRVMGFSKVCKNKKSEADLLMLILEIPFSLSGKILGTCFTVLDYKVALILKKVITLINTKLHPDYKMEYQEKINRYLNIMHSTSNHIDSVYALPKEL